MAEKPTYEELEQRIQELEQVESERKQTKQRKTLNVRILDTINKSEVWKDCIEKILGEIKQFTGFEAIAIRLREGEDFPYYVTKGFPAHFVEAERYLCTRDHKGEIVRDSEGNPYVECMCGNIICGRTDTSKDFFTEGGSFWSNNTSKLLSETTDEDRQTRTRNRCNSEGYESVALFPLKAGHEILGLLQINDMRTDQFTDDTIRFFEDIGISIGTAFSRKRAKTALQESKEKYRLVIETIVHGVQEIDISGKIVFGNSAYHKMLGYENGELIGRSMYETISDDYGQKELRDYVQILIQQQPKPESWFSKIVKKDGDTLDVQIDWNYKRNRQGEIIGFISIITDITERKQVEEALQESEKKFQAVADFTYDWEYWVAPDGRHIYVSPSCKRITGYAPDDFKNNPELMMEIIHPDDRAMVTKHHHRVDKSDRLWPIDFRIITKDGNERWIGHICQAVFDTDGRFLGRRGSNRDITQQKKLQEELLK